MTTMTCPTAFAAQQTLIDARLDTIDRMLINHVSRLDRIAIVREVESQIYEQLSDRDPSTLCRDDVLDVLKRLDPPEAYLPDDTENGPSRVMQRPIAAPPSSHGPASKAAKFGGLISGLAGLAAFALFLVECVMFMVASSLSGDVGLACLLLVPSILLGIASAVFGFVMGLRNRRQGAWPILGMILSAIAFPIWVLGLLYMVLLILN